MGRRRVFGVAVVLAGLATGSCGPGRVPAGQPDLVTISEAGMAAIREEFNQVAAQPRALLLISPT